MATIYYANGTTKDVQPANRQYFTLKELQAIVAGPFEVLADLPDGRIMIGNEEGRLLHLPRNEEATKLIDSLIKQRLEERSRLKEQGPPPGWFVIDTDPGGAGDYIVGDVLVCSFDEVR